MKKIKLKDYILAKTLQMSYPALQKVAANSPKLEFATKKIDPPKKIEIPTRHGIIKAYVFSPTEEDIMIQKGKDLLPPVHMIVHGGAFILRYPLEEDNVARYLASELSCYVIIPDYEAAPQVQFPVSEEECYDAFLWIHNNGTKNNWDGERVSVGGSSAGSKLALSVALQAIENKEYIPIALTSEYGVVDISIPVHSRYSAKKHPLVSPSLVSLALNTYFKGSNLKSPLVSPNYDKNLNKLPPILIMTAEYDTVGPESKRFALQLKELGVDVTYQEFEGVDHLFTHLKPVSIAKKSIFMIGEHLKKAYQIQNK